MYGFGWYGKPFCLRTVVEGDPDGAEKSRRWASAGSDKQSRLGIADHGVEAWSHETTSKHQFRHRRSEFASYAILGHLV